MFNAPYVWMPLMFRWLPVSLDAPICLPVCLDTPICLGTPVCLDTPYVWMPPYAWMMFGSPWYICMLCQTRGVHMHPYIWMPLYV